MSFAVTPQAAGFFALLLALVAAAIAMTRVAVGARWPAPAAAALAGAMAPLGYVLWLLVHSAANLGQLRTILTQSWAEIVLFCLPFVVAAELAAWLWQYFDPA